MRREVWSKTVPQITSAATVLMICGVVALAWKGRSNLQRQRADRQGAFRSGRGDVLYLCRRVGVFREACLYRAGGRTGLRAR